MKPPVPAPPPPAMACRLSLGGDGALARVAEAVVARMARDAGLHEDEARDLAQAAVEACERAVASGRTENVTVRHRGIEASVLVSPARAPGAGQAAAPAELHLDLWARSMAPEGP